MCWWRARHRPWALLQVSVRCVCPHFEHCCLGGFLLALAHGMERFKAERCVIRCMKVWSELIDGSFVLRFPYRGCFCYHSFMSLIRLCHVLVFLGYRTPAPHMNISNQRGFSHVSDKFKGSVEILNFTINDITELSYVITNYRVKVGWNVFTTSVEFSGPAVVKLWPLGRGVSATEVHAVTDQNPYVGTRSVWEAAG